MAVRNEMIDKARRYFIDYIKLNKISAQEWTFIDSYINQRFDKEKDKTTIK